MTKQTLRRQTAVSQNAKKRIAEVELRRRERKKEEENKSDKVRVEPVILTEELQAMEWAGVVCSFMHHDTIEKIHNVHTYHLVCRNPNPSVGDIVPISNTICMHACPFVHAGS